MSICQEQFFLNNAVSRQNRNFRATRTPILPKQTMLVTRCDIFCKVIDNYGDIGVCWRLARQLATEHPLVLRLWVDDLVVFARLDARVDALAKAQHVAGVEISQWDEAIHAEAADIVIEAFACDPPDAYIAAMAARPSKPAWINLEYLTAEDWAAGSHALPSPHPRLPLVKHFFFPGFTPGTGGLIREAGLIDALHAFQSDAPAQSAFWQRIAGAAVAEEALKVSLFAYENAALPELLDAWAKGERDIFCAVTAGRHVPQVEAWAESMHSNTPAHPEPFDMAQDTLRGANSKGSSPLHPDASTSSATQTTLSTNGLARVGHLTLAFLPFLSQDDYDLLLAACDLNFVRGEDSFVRAQWAGRPFVWHIYQQIDAAHLPKLAAFLDLYCAGLAAPEQRALRELWQAWEEEADAGMRWNTLLATLPAQQDHAKNWRKNLVSQGDLASKLLIFCQNLLECSAL